MTQKTPDPEQGQENTPGLGSVAEELRQESKRLRRLAAELKTRAEALAEMQANHPHLKQAVYAALREQFERELPPLPEKDLESLAAEEGGQPLESFIADLERISPHFSPLPRT